METVQNDRLVTVRELGVVKNLCALPEAENFRFRKNYYPTPQGVDARAPRGTDRSTTSPRRTGWYGGKAWIQNKNGGGIISYLDYSVHAIITWPIVDSRRCLYSPYIQRAFLVPAPETTKRFNSQCEPDVKQCFAVKWWRYVGHGITSSVQVRVLPASSSPPSSP